MSPTKPQSNQVFIRFLTLFLLGSAVVVIGAMTLSTFAASPTTTASDTAPSPTAPPKPVITDHRGLGGGKVYLNWTGATPGTKSCMGDNRPNEVKIKRNDSRTDPGGTRWFCADYIGPTTLVNQPLGNMNYRVCNFYASTFTCSDPVWVLVS